MVMKIEAAGTATAVTATAVTRPVAASLPSLYRAGIFLLLFLPNTGTTTNQPPWPQKNVLFNLKKLNGLSQYLCHCNLYNYFNRSD
jgi:hypothetical protein